MGSEIRGILFDKDDTLIDLAAFWRLPVSRSSADVARRCGRADEESLLHELEEAAGFDGGALIPESPIVAGTNLDVARAWICVLRQHTIEVEAGAEQDYARVLAQECLSCGEVKGTADLAHLLPLLKQRGFRLGVATSDNYTVTMHCLQKLGIDACFDCILCADRVRHPKPAPDTAEEFCRLYGFTPAEIAMVGDSANDMLFAKNSGITGIYYSAGAPQTPLPTGADYCIRNLSELERLLPAPKEHRQAICR